MEQYLKTDDPDWFKQRLILVILCISAVFVLLLGRLFQLQIIEGRELRRLSANNCIRLQSIEPPRGLIFDRNSELLVDNRPAFDLSIIPKDAWPIDTTVEKLARNLNVSSELLAQKIDEGKPRGFYKPIMIRQDIGRDVLAAVEVHQYELPGIRVDIKPRRQYITPKSASHLIGYLGEISTTELQCDAFPGCKQGDYIGKFGIEKSFESLLRGERGGRQVEVDARGRVVRVLKTVEAIPGFNLILSIDQVLQNRAEELLEGSAGAVVAMKPTTGEILAMASSPTFDQNDFVDGMSHDQWNALISNPNRPMENKVIQAEYPPASTYKIITAIAGLEEGIINENTTFYCPGQYQFGNRVYRCWKKGGHGKMDVIEALSQSCDVYFYQVGQKLGVDRLAWYANACGLGSPTGIELDHESAGLVPTAAWKKRRTGEPWQRGETLSIAIGQGYNLVTPLQMAVFTSALANGGERFKPQVVKRVERAGGQSIEEHPPTVIGRIPISEHTLSLVKKGIWRAVNHIRGTAKKIKLKGIDISGKTGTAQVFSRKQNEDNRKTPTKHHLKPHAWFVAFAPSQNPEIAIAVIVEHGEHGSSAAAPIAGELIKTYLIPDVDTELLHAENEERSTADRIN